MYTEERYNYILDELDKKGSVNVTELSQVLNVSEVTVRKDLNILEDRNLAKRTYGGAVKILKHVSEISLEQKNTSMIAQKKLIAKYASRFLSDDLNIFLDAGTTCQMLIEYIAKMQNITVITYDLLIAYSLAKYENVKVMILGGYVDFNTRTALSLAGYENIKRINADIAFLGTDAFDDKFAYSTSEIKSDIKKAMALNSELSVLISDSSKFEKKGLYSFCKLSDIDYFISDSSNEKLCKTSEKRGNDNIIIV